jgi:hypothetical protein
MGIYVGIVAGQLVYMIIFTPFGPLFLIGIPLLLVYSLFALIGPWIMLKRKLTK